MEEITLSKAASGKTYIVHKIKDEDRLINRLSSMGIMNGVQIDICQNYKKQPVLIYVRDTMVAIGRSESEKIILGGISNE